MHDPIVLPIVATTTTIQNDQGPPRQRLDLARVGDQEAGVREDQLGRQRHHRQFDRHGGHHAEVADGPVQGVQERDDDRSMKDSTAGQHGRAGRGGGSTADRTAVRGGLCSRGDPHRRAALRPGSPIGIARPRAGARSSSPAPISRSRTSKRSPATAPRPRWTFTPAPGCRRRATSSTDWSRRARSSTGSRPGSATWRRPRSTRSSAGGSRRTS